MQKNVSKVRNLAIVLSDTSIFSDISKGKITKNLAFQRNVVIGEKIFYESFLNKKVFTTSI